MHQQPYRHLQLCPLPTAGFAVSLWEILLKTAYLQGSGESNSDVAGVCPSTPKHLSCWNINDGQQQGATAIQGKDGRVLKSSLNEEIKAFSDLLVHIHF